MDGGKTLIFVYNADSGFFNLVTDAAHKIFSPSTYACNLCALTHGNFGPRGEWRNYLKTLPYTREFLHADEFARRFPSGKVELPAIFTSNARGIELLVPADSINRCSSLSGLKSLIDQAIEQHG